MNDSEVLSRLVIGHKRDGRCRYDPAAKQELIRQCKLLGVTVSRMASQHGINANLLRAWIAKSLLRESKDAQMTSQEARRVASLPSCSNRATADTAGAYRSAYAFVRVPRSSPSAPALRLHVNLPNGVGIDIDTARADELMPVMQLLSTLTCSS